MLAGLTRTVVPFVVAWALALPVTPWVLDVLGVTTAQAERAVAGAATVVVGGVYYFAVRLLERYRSQLWGWLLGWAAAPSYERPVTPGS